MPTRPSLRAADARDADDDAEKNDGGDHHADELDEAVAEGLELLGEVRIDDADENAGDDAYEHTEVQSAKEGVASSWWRRQECSSLPATWCSASSSQMRCTQSS
jgi:hypothetical protein